jgi:hypothetical protein
MRTAQAAPTGTGLRGFAQRLVTKVTTVPYPRAERAMRVQPQPGACLWEARQQLASAGLEVRNSRELPPSTSRVVDG